jgi:CRISPR-associated protein Csm4
MAKLVCYRLVAQSAWHLGERGVGMEETSVILHADTLFSAVCLALAELGADLVDMLERFPGYAGSQLSPGQPPFWITSAFPFSGQVYLFPRPLLPFPFQKAAGGLPRLGKTLKRIQFVSKAVLEKLLAGEPMDDELLMPDPQRPSEVAVRKEALIQSGRVWIARDELDRLSADVDRYTGAVRIWADAPRPRVTLDRITNRSQVYAAGEVVFAAGSGLFFLASYQDDDPAWREKLESALRLLADTGIGGERSSGFGRFELRVDDQFHLEEPAEPDGYLTLAPTWPTPAEIQANLMHDSAYQLINRRGWVGSPRGLNLQKSDVRMLAEGAVFHTKPAGALVDVAPVLIDAQGEPKPFDHKVWRYGLAYPLGWKKAQA